MPIPPYVRPIPKRLLKLPWFSSVNGFLLINKIYLRPKIFNDLQAKKPNPVSRSILIHEETHKNRAAGGKSLRFILKYIFNSKFRLYEELAAIKPQMKILKETNTPYYFEKKAQALSGWLYFWSTDYETALRELKKVWDEV